MDRREVDGSSFDQNVSVVLCHSSSSSFYIAELPVAPTLAM